MTEQEIVSYLKENRMKGIGYKFMPEEVQKWIYDNFYNDYLVYFNYQGKWTSINDTNLTNSCNYQNHIFSLSEDFELKKEVEGKWVEFDIDENGCYRILDTDMRFHWSEWNKPLWVYEKDENRSWYLTAFGGWQYKENLEMWFMSPQVLKDNDLCCIKPLFPIKIRFWRELQ